MRFQERLSTVDTLELRLGNPSMESKQVVEQLIPSDQDAERSVLGSILLDAEALVAWSRS